MTNTALLRQKIKESGMTIVSICEKTGILRETLYNKLNGEREFKASEIYLLSEVLNLSYDDRDAIFFAGKVELNATKREES